jgi:hypothetical protein
MQLGCQRGGREVLIRVSRPALDRARAGQYNVRDPKKTLQQLYHDFRSSSCFPVRPKCVSRLYDQPGNAFDPVERNRIFEESFMSRATP